MKRVEIINKKRIFDDFFKIDAVSLKHELFSGEMSEPMRRLNFERGDSVAVLIWNKESKCFVLIEQFRYPTYEKGPGWLLEIPAGVIEKDEDPISTIKREIIEETGYQSNGLTHIYSFYVSPGGTSERLLLYYTEVENKDKIETGGGLDSEHEDIRVLEIPFTELWDALESGRIIDAKTIIALQWFRLHEMGK